MRSDHYVSTVLARVRLLCAVYAVTFGDRAPRLDVAPLARALGFDGARGELVARGLISSGLLSVDRDGFVSITARGLRAVERLAVPESPARMAKALPRSARRRAR